MARIVEIARPADIAAQFFRQVLDLPASQDKAPIGADPLQAGSGVGYEIEHDILLVFMEASLHGPADSLPSGTAAALRGFGYGERPTETQGHGAG